MCTQMYLEAPDSPLSMDPSHKCFKKDELLEIGVSGTQEA